MTYVQSQRLISTIAVPAVYVSTLVPGSHFQLSDLAAARSTVEIKLRVTTARHVEMRQCVFPVFCFI